ncbi:hypothetical protein ACWD4O_26535 [Streptomyces sp. NPDC002623]
MSELHATEQGATAAADAAAREAETRATLSAVESADAWAEPEEPAKSEEPAESEEPEEPEEPGDAEEVVEEVAEQGVDASEGSESPLAVEDAEEPEEPEVEEPEEPEVEEPEVEESEVEESEVEESEAEESEAESEAEAEAEVPDSDVVEDVEAEENHESAEPEALDEADALHETVDRPRIEHMYDDEGSEPRNLTYGDPINEGQEDKVPLFDGPPTREQMSQGGLGDCGVVCSIRAVAGHRPDAIENSVHENPDGTYAVSLYETKRGEDGVYRSTAQKVELSVTPELPVREDAPDTPAFAQMGSSAWGAVLEKAMAGVDQTWDSDRQDNWESRWQYAKDDEKHPDGPTPVGYERLNQGSSQWDQAEMLTQLTGDDSAVYAFPDGPGGGQALEGHLQSQLADNKPILAGTRQADHEAGEKELPYRLVEGHAYEVVGAEDGMVHLKNPWGFRHPDPIPTDEFIDYFSHKVDDVSGKKAGYYATLT